ncbi:hypothetical protein DLE01_10535, partial [Streptomyces sp. FT05W]
MKERAHTHRRRPGRRRMAAALTAALGLTGRGLVLRESPEKLVVRMWLFPYLTWATIAMISFVLVYMLTDDA